MTITALYHDPRLPPRFSPEHLCLYVPQQEASRSIVSSRVSKGAAVEAILVVPALDPPSGLIFDNPLTISGAESTGAELAQIGQVTEMRHEGPAATGG